MTHIRKGLLAATAAVALIGLASQAARATPIISYSATSGGTQTAITGNGTYDGLTVSGFSVGSNAPGVTNNANVISSTLSVANDTGSTQTAFFYVGDTGFTSPTTPPAAKLELFNGLGGTVTLPSADEAISVITCADQGNGSNTCPNTTYKTAAVSPALDGQGSSFSQSNTQMIGSLAPPYSISAELEVTLGAGGQINFTTTSAVETVAEPSSMLPLAVGLMGLTTIAFAGRRQRRG
jgi:hypothetical protein